MEKLPAELYRERVQRFEDAINLRLPDRVPTLPTFGYFPAKYAGMTIQEAFNNCDKWWMANKKTVIDLEPDIFTSPGVPNNSSLELYRVKNMKWPGHGVSANSGIQAIEAENMKPEEYDTLIDDPTDFAIRTYLPRISGIFTPLQRLPSIGGLLHFGPTAAMPFLADPEVIAACEAIAAAERINQKWNVARLAFRNEMDELGFPSFCQGGAMCPFDHISDHLRGMQGAILDMYRRPDKLLKAIEKLLPLTISSALSAAKGFRNAFGNTLMNNITFFGPHRGDHTFMSIKQFEKFYWPNLKAVIMAFIDEGFIPYIFWEGDYTSRLEYIAELPKGKVFNYFDRTDMTEAKEVLGGHHCIGGGMMLSVLCTGTIQDVKDQCKRLIDTCGKGGGYIMMPNCLLDDAKPENVKAMIDFTREYGKY